MMTYHRLLRRLHLASAIFLVIAATGHLQAQTSPYKTMTLDNGLEVIVIENRTVPLATISIAVRNGAFTEPDEFAGLSHLYEHMFFKSNAAIPSQEKFMARVRQLGIVFNGYTSEDVVVYFFTLPAKNLEPGVNFMADAIKSPLFNEEELVKEREVVLGEFDRNEADPQFVLDYAIDSALWMPYVSRKQPLGQRAVIQNATVGQMRLIQELFYLPNNSALIVSGDVKAEKVFALAKKYLADWKKGSPPFPSYSPPPFPRLKPMLVVREAAIPDVTLQLYYHGPSIPKESEASQAATLFTLMINQPNSRFQRNLIDSGVALDASARYRVARNVGTLGFGLSVSPDKARSAYQALRSEIAAMGRPGYFTPEEMEIGKQIITNQKLFEQDNPQSFNIGTTARWWSWTGLDYYLSYAPTVARVNEGQLKSFIDNYIIGQPFVLGVGARKATLDALNFTAEDLR